MSIDSQTAHALSKMTPEAQAIILSLIDRIPSEVPATRLTKDEDEK